MPLPTLTETELVDVGGGPTPATPALANLPSYNAGDVIGMIVTLYSGGGGNLELPVGWVEKFRDTGTDTDLGIFFRQMDGTEGSTVEIFASQVFDLTVQAGVLINFRGDIANDIEVSSSVDQPTSSSIGTIDPAAITASWGAEATNTFVSVCTISRGGPRSFSQLPATYNFQQTDSGTDASNFGVGLAVGNKDANAASDDPGIYNGGTFRRMRTVGFVIRGVTPDVTAPTNTVTPTASSPTSSGHTISGQINEGGTVYIVRLPAADADPSPAQVVAGQDSTGSVVAAADRANTAATTDTTWSIVFTGGTPSTAYKYHVAAQDTATPPNVQASTVVISASTTALVFEIGAISDSTPMPGETFTVAITNPAATVTASLPSGALTIDSQTSTLLTITAPQPLTHGDGSLDFIEDTTVTVTDGTTPRTFDIQIQPETGYVYGTITAPDPAGIYADDGPGASDPSWSATLTGAKVYGQLLTGDAIVDLGTGLWATTSVSTFRYALYDGNWSGFATETFNPIVLTAPTVTTQPAAQTIQEGSATSVTFTVAFAGTPVPDIQWQKDAQGNGVFADIAGQTGATLLVAGTSVTVAANNGDQYRAVGDNGQSPAATTNAVALTVTAPLTKTATITGVVNADGSPFTGTVENWYLTLSDIEASNKAGTAITVIASGENLQFTNGTAQVVTPSATVGLAHTLTGYNNGATLNDQTVWFRDVDVVITEA